jgi:hypothetical protein
MSILQRRPGTDGVHWEYLVDQSSKNKDASAAQWMPAIPYFVNAPKESGFRALALFHFLEQCDFGRYFAPDASVKTAPFSLHLTMAIEAYLQAKKCTFS